MVGKLAITTKNFIFQSCMPFLSVILQLLQVEYLNSSSISMEYRNFVKKGNMSIETRHHSLFDFDFTGTSTGTVQDNGCPEYMCKFYEVVKHFIFQFFLIKKIYILVISLIILILVSIFIKTNSTEY